MLKPITIQQLTDASQDATSLSEFMFKPADYLVPRRLSPEIPTLNHYLNYFEGISKVFTQPTGTVTVDGITVPALATSIEVATAKVFELGGLPATPFATKALMTASALVDGKYAMVTDDTVAADNGLYVKTAGVWTKTKYDPIANAKGYTDGVFSNLTDPNTEKYYGQAAFSNAGAYNKNGDLRSATDYPDWYYTDKIPVFAGDVVTVRTRIPSSGNVYLMVWNSAGARVAKYTTPQNYLDYETFTQVITVDGAIAAQHAAGFDGSSITINKKPFVSEKSLPRTAAFINKADKSKFQFLEEFEQGYVDDKGNEVVATNRIRSIVYKLPIGTVVTITRPTKNVDAWFSYSTSPTAKVGVSKLYYEWLNTNEFTVVIPPDEPYFRVYFRASGDTPVTLQQRKDNLSVFIKSEVAYTQKDALPASIEVYQDFNSMYRNPSLATGGVVSFIDDDGRDSVFTGLLPFMRSNNAPFGAAIVTGRLGTPPYISVAQLDAMIEQKDIVEIMSHSAYHDRLTDSAVYNDTEREQSIVSAKKYLHARGAEVTGFVLPYGADDANVRRIVQKHHAQCYDYQGDVRVETFSTIRNSLISRTAWDKRVDRVAYHKALIDDAFTKNGWLVICTHVDAPLYWDSASYADLLEVINYIKSKNMRILKPNDAFQIFGNMMENDSGFKIQADGKIVGAT